MQCPAGPVKKNKTQAHGRIREGKERGGTRTRQCKASSHTVSPPRAQAQVRADLTLASGIQVIIRNMRKSTMRRVRWQLGWLPGLHARDGSKREEGPVDTEGQRETRGGGGGGGSKRGDLEPHREDISHHPHSPTAPQPHCPTAPQPHSHTNTQTHTTTQPYSPTAQHIPTTTPNSPRPPPNTIPNPAPMRQQGERIVPGPTAQCQGVQ